jgi:hypothetical protein
MNECEFFAISDKGTFFCEKITTPFKEITKEICKTACPVYHKRCVHLSFSLRKDEHFSAIGLGGRRIVIKFDRAVCGKLKEPIFDIKRCDTCLNFVQATEKEREEPEDIVERGKRALVDALGEDGAELFIQRIKEGGPSEKPVEKEEKRELDEFLPENF